MKVLNCRVEHVKGVDYAEVDFGNRAVTVIGGDNHQGKSSFLDSIKMAICGKRAFPPDPIKEGEDEAEVVVNIDGGIESLPWPCTITRSIKRGDEGGYTTKVVITADDGQTAPSPQTLLNTVVGDGLGFDALSFSAKSPKEQADILRKLVGLDFTEIDQQRQKLYDERTRINRDAKQLEGKIAKTELHLDVPADPVNITDLMTQLEVAEKRNAEIHATQEKLASTVRQIDTYNQKISDLMAAVKQLEADAEKLRDADKITINTAPIKQAMVDSQTINAKIAQNRERLELLTQQKTLERESKVLTKAIEKVDKEKSKMLTNANWPVEGLGFGHDGITWNGIAFEQLASSEQFAVAVAIALGINKDFPFVIIRDGSLLDDASMQQLHDIVTQHNGQCLLEKVSKGSECHVIFEEGRRVR